MIKKVAELLFTKDLRQWLGFKLLHPSDKYANHFSNPYIFDDELVKEVHKPEWVEMRPLQLLEEGETEIRLASKKMSPTEFRKYSSINGEGLSGEDAEALYRFNGCVLLATEGKLSKQLLEDLITLWMEYYPSYPVAMGSYVISERMANLGILLGRSKIYDGWTPERKEKFHSSVKRDLIHLKNNLEYFGERLTGNHLSNNARGLIWGAYLNGNKPLMGYALGMMMKEAERIFESQGILREGSSHYQSLIGRNYLEAWILTKDGNLKILVEKILRGVELVKPFGKEIFIGDISPDFPVSYFDNVAHFFNKEGVEVESSGWTSHFKDRLWKKNHSFKILTETFFRVDHQGLSIVGHFNKEGFPLLAGHAHCDSGGFVVVRQDQEIFIDLGRLNYDSRDDEYLKASAHNGLTVNRRPIETLNRGVFGPKFIQSRSRMPKLKLLENGASIQTQWREFGVDHERVLKIEDQKMMVSDHFVGNGEHDLELFFHFANKKLAENIVRQYPGASLKVVPRAIDYGKKDEAYRVEFNFRKVRLPFVHVLVIDDQQIGEKNA